MKASWSFLFVANKKSTSELQRPILENKDTMEAERQQKDRGKRKLAVSRTKGMKEKSAAVMWWWGWGKVKRRSVTPGVSQTLAALQFVPLLAISGGRDADVHNVVAWRLVVCRSVCYLLLRHNAVDFCNDNNNINICADCWKQDLRFHFVFDTKPAHAWQKSEKPFATWPFKALGRRHKIYKQAQWRLKTRGGWLCCTFSFQTFFF